MCEAVPELCGFLEEECVVDGREMYCAIIDDCAKTPYTCKQKWWSDLVRVFQTPS